jgi:hypothetical protein
MLSDGRTLSIALGVAAIILVPAVAYSIWETRKNGRRIEEAGRREIDWWENWLKARHPTARRVIGHSDTNPATYQVQVMTVQCPCGCGALTVIPFRGILYAHLWADQIRFTVLHSHFWTKVVTWPLRKGVRARLVMLGIYDRPARAV